MKGAVLLIAMMFLSVVGFSQSTLKGPEAKNATAAELAANASQLKFYSAPTDVKGPQAKNFKVWKKSEVSTKNVYIRRDQVLPKGPKAKNKKVREE